MELIGDPERPEAPVDAAAPGDDDVRTLSQRYPAAPSDAPRPTGDRRPNDPDTVRAAVAEIADRLDRCLVDAGAAPDAGGSLELELGLVATGDRGALSVVDVPAGVDAERAIPCLASALGGLAFDPPETPEALTVPVLAAPDPTR